MTPVRSRALGSRTTLADAAETLLCAWLVAATLSGLLLNGTFGWWSTQASGARD